MDSLSFSFDKNSLSEKVYEFLRSQIMSGKLPPNTRLLETELADSLKVSRAPVREALNFLVNDGFVVKIPRQGAIVAPVTRKEVLDNWEIRKLIEPYAAKISCPFLPKAELKEVKQLILNTKNTGNYDMYMDSDYKTHSIIYRYVPNNQLQVFLKQSMQNSMRYRFYAENSHPTYDIIRKTVCDEHLALVDALLEGDADQAYDCMLFHIEKGQQRYELQFPYIN